MLGIRLGAGMISLTGAEANELRERLRHFRSTQPAEATIGVSVNASTSVTFTGAAEKEAVLYALEQWFREVGRVGMGDGPSSLREALLEELERPE
jgi:hypothetical protein